MRFLPLILVILMWHMWIFKHLNKVSIFGEVGLVSEIAFVSRRLPAPPLINSDLLEPDWGRGQGGAGGIPLFLPPGGSWGAVYRLLKYRTVW